MAVLFDLQQQTLLISFGFRFFRFSREITLRFMQALNLCTLGLRKDTFESSLREKSRSICLKISIPHYHCFAVDS